jgi:hypothetical protein
VRRLIAASFSAPKANHKQDQCKPSKETKDDHMHNAVVIDLRPILERFIDFVFFTFTIKTMLAAIWAPA